MSASRDPGIAGLRRTLIAWAIAFLFGIGLSVPAAATEVIRSFSANAVLDIYGTLKVTEIITVRAEGIKIKRGIYRDIPTVRVFKNGEKRYSALDILSVRRDGKSEPYHVEAIANGERIYFGDRNVFLQPGTYTYTLVYEITRMAGRFADHDELYWNATGNYWDFPMGEAVATLTLPKGAVISKTAAYVGAYGATAGGESAGDVTVLESADNIAIFRLNHPLAAYQGMTVAASFQKGILAAPGPLEHFSNFLSDWRGLVFPGLSLFLVLLYNVFAWDAVGRDPRKGTIIPLFYPPKGFSPALVHYVHYMGWRNNGWTAFSAALTDLAVKGIITITSPSAKDVRYAETGKPATDLPPGEAVVFGYLKGMGEVKVDKKSGPGLNATRRLFLDKIGDENRTVYFNNNIVYVIFGIVLTIALLAGMVLLDVLDPGWLIAALVIGAVLGGIVSVVRAGIGAARNTMRIFSFIWIAVVGFNVFVGIASAFPLTRLDINPATVAAVSIVLIEVVFASLMRAPTIQGRKVMDGIDGFKMYLDTAEKERLNFRDEPEMSVSRYETLLPYAIALGVEKPWTDRFEADLARHAVSGVSRSYTYAPHWYSGTSFSSGGVGASMAALASGMSAAMIASQPASSSSSGGGGGGFSGGGGGGGGGGGW